MTTALPHSSIVAKHLSEFLDDLDEEVRKSIACLRNSANYRGVFKNSLAAYVILKVLGRRELPLLKGATGITRRLPLLVACRQVSLAYVELRRFVELATWYPYFREHPVEWQELQENPERGFTRDADKPIVYCAHREISWYIAYARERFSEEPSGLAKEAIDALFKAHRNLSAHVHAVANTMPGGFLKDPFDSVAPNEIRNFQKIQRRVLSAGCILIAAAKPEKISKLEAVDRAWFDWLVGRASARKIRSEPFGLPSA